MKAGLGPGSWERVADKSPRRPGHCLVGETLELTGTSLSVPSFPAEHFGKLFGLLMTLSAIVSLFQFPIFTLIRGPLQNNPFYVSTGAGAGDGTASSGGAQHESPPNTAVS